MGGLGLMCLVVVVGIGVYYAMNPSTTTATGSGSSAAATTPPTYKEIPNFDYPGTNIGGGYLVSADKQGAACKQVCDTDTSCMGYNASNGSLLGGDTTGTWCWAKSSLGTGAASNNLNFFLKQ